MDAETALKNAWRSQRLSYRAAYDSDKTWWIEHFRREPTALGLSSFAPTAPPSQAACEEAFAGFQASLLAVVVQLGREQDGGMVPEERIGFISLFQNGKEANRHHRAAHMGVGVAETFRGRGYGAEAMAWALDWAFGTVGLHRVAVECMAFNTRAEKIYRGLGFTEEGRERDMCWFGGHWWDVVLFSMLDEEWAELRPRKRTTTASA